MIAPAAGINVRSLVAAVAILRIDFPTLNDPTEEGEPILARPTAWGGRYFLWRTDKPKGTGPRRRSLGIEDAFGTWTCPFLALPLSPEKRRGANMSSRRKKRPKRPSGAGSTSGLY